MQETVEHFDTIIFTVLIKIRKQVRLGLLHFANGEDCLRGTPLPTWIEERRNLQDVHMSRMFSSIDMATMFALV
jgi:hypothetical protein